MSRIGRPALITTCVMSVALVGAAVSSASAGTTAPSARSLFPLGFYAANVSLKSTVDPNFCVQDTPSAGGAGSPGSMSVCAARNNQRWMFAQAANNAEVLIDGSGQCLDFGNRAGGSIRLPPCTFGTPEQFLFNSSTGQLENTTGKLCLQAAAAAQDASLAIEKCASTVTLQTWSLGQ